MATPETAMKPTAAEIENGIPRSKSASAPPTRASGTQAKTSAASVTEPRAKNSSTAMTTNTAGTMIASRALARSRFWN